MVITIPRDADGLRDTLTDRSKVTELLKSPDTLANFVEDHIKLRNASDPGVTEQLKQQTHDYMIQWLRDHADDSEIRATAKRLNLDNPTAKVHKPNTLYNKDAFGARTVDGVRLDTLFDSVPEFLHAISNHSHKSPDLQRKLGYLQNDLSSVKPSDGGFLIPEVLRSELLRVALERAIVRSRARVIPMDSLTVPFPTVDSTSNASSVYGGVTGYWTEEGATLSESQPSFGRVELKAQKLTIYTEVPNELIRDAQPSLTAFLNEILPEALAWFEDVGFFGGSGTGEPLGFMNAPARVLVTRNAGGLAVEWIDIVTMFSRLLPASMGRAVWIVSPDVITSLFQMTISGGTAPILLGGTGFATGSVMPPMTMLGIPLIVSEKAAASGTQGDVNLVDFGYYLIGDRQAMSARQSEEFRFQNDITAFRIIERVDGRPWLRAPITPQNGSSNTLSPFVQLV